MITTLKRALGAAGTLVALAFATEAGAQAPVEVPFI
jgi:hypothetical protein